MADNRKRKLKKRKKRSPSAFDIDQQCFKVESYGMAVTPEHSKKDLGIAPKLRSSFLVITHRDADHQNLSERRSRTATSLFALFMSAEACHAIIGDLQEGFSSKAKNSIRKAHLWYWSQLLRSFPPLIWAAFVRRFNPFSRRT